MAEHEDDYRARLLEAVRRARVQQEMREMTDEQLNAVICSSLGLPLGTTFTDEQLRMIINNPERRRSRRSAGPRA